ncbi:phage protein GemA/Gp16 family protein [Pararhizobium sp.]|uniref:phage protein GemA/Gp16 family protein n=1 Tax=Pararhizobium sp. TaxID=1977563 RepID=UPI003D1270C0
MSNAIAAINIAKNQLGMDDDTYRAKLINITGESSLRKMTEPQLQSVVEVFRKEGFQHRPKATDGRRELAGPFLGKLRAMWIAGYNLGVFVDRNDSAMLAFVKRQAKVDDTRFLFKIKDARAAIEGLKAWLGREGGVDWSDASIMPDYARADGFKIAWAQWLKLGGNAHANSVHEFHTAVVGIAGVSVQDCKPKDWQSVSKSLGFKVRAAAKRKAL